MKTRFTMIFSIGFMLLASAQSIDKQVVATAGNTSSNASHKLTTTIGEPIVGLKSTTVSISQGFLAGAATNETLSIETLIDSPTVKIFPNPVTDSVHISMPNNTEQVTTTIYDITGKLITEQTTNSELQTLNVSAFNKGVYMIQLQFKDSNKIKTFKIIKK